jgi:hypothetical protein
MGANDCTSIMREYQDDDIGLCATRYLIILQAITTTLLVDLFPRKTNVLIAYSINPYYFPPS